MTNLVFDFAAVEELMDHAENASDWSMGYEIDIPGEPKPERKPALLLVKDEGIYLMSNGKPNLPRKDGKEGSHVVYAEGYDPNKDDRMEVWEDARAAVGGDDFAELLPWIEALRELRRIHPHRSRLVIKAKRDTFELKTDLRP